MSNDVRLTELDRTCLQQVLMVERGYALARDDRDVVEKIDEFIADMGTSYPWCHEAVCAFINEQRGLGQSDQEPEIALSPT